MKKILLTVLSVITLILLLILGFSSIEKIHPGYVGVVYSPNGGIKNETLSQGWHIVNPIYKITEYTVATEQGALSKDKREGSPEDESFFVPTLDGKQVNIDLEYSYKFIPEKVTEVFTNFRGKSGKEIERSFMRAKLKTYTADVTSKYSVLDIYGPKRVQLNNDIYNYINKKFEKYGIDIETVNVAAVRPDQATEVAIQSRVNSQQELERQKIEREKAKIQAEKLVIEEEGRKKVSIVKAQAKAEQIRIEAEAQAKANRELSESLTNNLVEYQKIQKWNGVLPQFQGNSVPMLQLNSNTK